MQKINKEEKFFRYETLVFAMTCVYICVATFVFCIMKNFPEHTLMVSLIAMLFLLISSCLFQAKTTKMLVVGNIINIALCSVISCPIVIKYINAMNIVIAVVSIVVCWYILLTISEFNKKFIMKHKKTINITGFVIIIIGAVIFFFLQNLIYMLNISVIIVAFLFIATGHIESSLSEKDEESIITHSCGISFLLLALFSNFIYLYGTLIA